MWHQSWWRFSVLRSCSLSVSLVALLKDRELTVTDTVDPDIRLHNKIDPAGQLCYITLQRCGVIRLTTYTLLGTELHVKHSQTADCGSYRTGILP